MGKNKHQANEKYMETRRTAIGKTRQFELSSGKTIEIEKIYQGWTPKGSGVGYDDLRSLDEHESAREKNK